MKRWFCTITKTQNENQGRPGSSGFTGNFWHVMLAPCFASISKLLSFMLSNYHSSNYHLLLSSTKLRNFPLHQAIMGYFNRFFLFHNPKKRSCSDAFTFFPESTPWFPLWTEISNALSHHEARGARHVWSTHIIDWCVRLKKKNNKTFSTFTIAVLYRSATVA